VTAAWQPSDNNRRSKYYSLTRAGERRLAAERNDWERSAAAINLILQTEA
jgi:DNA-binding PadR family transcriptional regulator